MEISLQDMNQRLDNLEKLTNNETNKQRRDDAKRRVSHLKTSHQQIAKALANYMKRRG